MELKPDFKQMLAETMGDEAGRLIGAIAAGGSVTSVRVNAAKGAAVPAGAERVAWCPEGFYCTERPQFTFDPRFHAGQYYVQDASSMFITRVIRQLVARPVRYLDLCAAPGGKTTAALSSLPAGSVVVANEVVPQRARVLADNVARWGLTQAVVASDTPRRFGALGAVFDVVAADVPCSGEGMMRKDDEAVAQWSKALVAQCAERQRAIIDDVWPALRQGGLLVYSTCTYNRDENEAIVEYVINNYGAEPVAVDIDPSWGIAPGIGTRARCYRFFPHRLRGEGLFMAVLRKTDAAPAAPPRSRTKGTPVQKNIIETAGRWLTGKYDFGIRGGVVEAYPPEVASLLPLLDGAVNVLRAGVTVAEPKGPKLMPSHGLALSTALSPGAFPAVDIAYSDALRYLRGEPVTVDAPRGFVLVCCDGVPLGFVNNLGPRANNLYPKPLRIVSTHLPAAPVGVLLPESR